MINFFEFFIKIKNKIGVYGLKICIKYPRPFPLALCLSLISKPLSSRKKFRVLAINKDISSYDVEALNDYGSDIQYICISAGLYKFILMTIMGDAFKNLSTKNYEKIPSMEKHINKYYSFMRKMIPIFNRMTKIDAVLACNFTYIGLREVAKVYSELKIPYVVMYKEGGMLPERKKEWKNYWMENYFDGTVYASKILTYNDSINWVFSNSGLKGLEKEKIITTGSPRLDYYRKSKKQTNDRKKLVVFGFDPMDVCFYFDEICENESSEFSLNFKKETILFYDTVKSFAKQYPEIDVIVKFKYPGYGTFIDNIKYELSKDNVKNLSILSDYPARDLILSATAVIAFNSFTAIEAILSDIPVMTPDFRKCFGDRPWNYFAKFPEISHYVSSVSDIEDVIFYDQVGNDSPFKVRNQFVKTHGGVGTNELSTQLVEMNVINAIESKYSA